MIYDFILPNGEVLALPEELIDLFIDTAGVMTSDKLTDYKFTDTDKVRDDYDNGIFSLHLNNRFYA